MSRRVVVTGGAAGIGRAMAAAFAAGGAHIAVCDVNADAVAQFRSQYPQAIVEVVDVCDETAMQQFFANIKTAWGGLDVVCANAGTGGPAGRIEDLKLADWQACLAVNLNGCFLTVKYARPLLARGGLILITASTAGVAGYPLRAPYATAKWGLVGLTKTLAMELGGAGIRVNALCPGAVEGERMERVLAAEAAAHHADVATMREQYVRGVSLKTWVAAEDIANMAVFLASDAAAKVSGQIVCIDGHTETLAP